MAILKKGASGVLLPALAVSAVLIASMFAPSTARLLGINVAACGYTSPAPTVTMISPASGTTLGGTTVTITGTQFCNGLVGVKFGATSATGVILNSNTSITATSPAHVAGTVDVTVTTAGGTSATSSADKFTFTTTPGACINASVTSDKAAPQSGGTVVTFTAVAGGCASPIFQWWIWSASTGYVMRQAYSATATFVLNTTGMAPGTYTIDVWVENTGSSMGTGGYETFGLEAWVVGGCDFASMTPNPGPATGVVHFVVTAGGAGCGTPQFQFWLFGPVTGWVMKQAYSATNTYDLDTSTLSSTTYTVDAWVKQLGSPMSYETWALSTVPKGACAASSVAPDLASPQNVGSTVTFTTTATGCASAQFRYWIFPGTGGAWQMLRDYSTVASFGWATAGLTPGTYTIDVHIRQGGSTAAYDTFALLSYTVTGITTAGLTTTQSSPLSLGGVVNINASSIGGTSPQYEFWVLPGSGGGWQVLQGYSALATVAWTPAARGTYALVVYARQTGSGSALDTFAVRSFSVT